MPRLARNAPTKKQQAEAAAKLKARETIAADRTAQAAASTADRQSLRAEADRKELIAAYEHSALRWEIEAEFWERAGEPLAAKSAREEAAARHAKAAEIEAEGS